MKAPTTKKKPSYVITLTLGDVKLKGEGATAHAALSSIRKPIKIVGKTFLTITKGDKKKDMMLMPTRAKRLFYPIAQIFLAKQLEAGMK